MKILEGGGVTGSRGAIFPGEVLNNLRKWRNESVNFSHCSVQIFIHYHNTIGLQEQRLEVFLENRCSEKYFLKSTQENLWLKYFKNTFEGAYFTCRFKACNFTKKWTSSQVFSKGFDHRFQNTFFPEYFPVTAFGFRFTSVCFTIKKSTWPITSLKLVILINISFLQKLLILFCISICK